MEKISVLARDHSSGVARGGGGVKGGHVPRAPGLGGAEMRE